MGVSKNNGTPKSSILIGFSIINHPFWGTSIYGNTHICIYIYIWIPDVFGGGFKPGTVRCKHVRGKDVGMEELKRMTSIETQLE